MNDTPEVNAQNQLVAETHSWFSRMRKLIQSTHQESLLFGLHARSPCYSKDQYRGQSIDVNGVNARAQIAHNVLSALSLALFAAIYFAWLSASGGERYELYHYGDSRYLNIGWSSSGVYLLTATYPPGKVPIDEPGIIALGYAGGVHSGCHRVQQWNWPMTDLVPHVLRTSTLKRDLLIGKNVRIFETSFWPLAGAFSILPGRYLFLWLRRRRRFVTGCCQNCGHDLRATGVHDATE